MQRRISPAAHAPSVDALRFGRSIRALRRRQQLRQIDLAERAGVSDSRISRIERGAIGGVSFKTLHVVAAALQADLQIQVRWQGEALDRLLDEAHAGIVDAAVARLQAAGWETVVEASFDVRGERGSMDVLGRHVTTGHVAVIEVKSVIPDVQALIFGLDRKARVAPIVARERGWPCAGVARLLFVAEGRTARRRVERHQSTFDAAFPVRSREALAWLRDPTGRPPSALVFVAGPEGSSSSKSRQARVGRGVVTTEPPNRHGPERGGAAGASTIAVKFPPGDDLAQPR